MSDVLISSPSLASPILFAVVFSSPLFGIAIAQTITYYRSYPNDSTTTKNFIGLLIALDTAHTLTVLHSAYFWYVHARLSHIMPMSLLISGFFAYFVVSAVQFAYAMRVWRLSQCNRWLTGIILLTSILQLVSGFGMNSRLVITRSVLSMHSRVSETLGGMQLATSVLCDGLITGSLVYLLRQGRSGFRSTRNIIDTLVIYSINIGLVTSILAIVTLIVWLSMPTSYIFSTFHVVISKFYVNSLLVSMNARRRLREASETTAFDSDGIDLRTLGELVGRSFSVAHQQD